MPHLPANTAKGSKLADGLFLLSFLIIYGLLIAHGIPEWRLERISILQNETPIKQVVLFFLFTMSFLCLVLTFARVHLKYWLFLVLCFVPLEFSKPFLFLPRFTPLDYLCAASVLSVLIYSPWKMLWAECRRIFGDWALGFWIGFLVYSWVMSYVLHGNPRGAFRWVGFLFCYFVTSRILATDLTFQEQLAALLTLLGTAVSLLGLYQISHIRAYTNVEALFNQHNICSAFLALCIPAMIGFARSGSIFPRLVKLFCLVISATAFLLAYSRGAWAGILVGSLLTFSLGYFPRRFSKRASAFYGLLAAGATALVVFTVVHNGSHLVNDSGRPEYWHAGLRVFSTHPWVGLGPGGYAKNIHAYLTPADRMLYRVNAEGHPTDFWQHLHNLYLQILVEYGLIGFAVWGLGLGSLIYRAWKGLPINGDLKTSLKPFFFISVVGFLVHNTVDIVTVNSFDMVFGILLAILAFHPPKKYSDSQQAG